MPILNILLQQQIIASDFDDLGRWLLAGFVAAIILAIGIVVVKTRTQDHKPQSDFISINAYRGDKEENENN